MDRFVPEGAGDWWFIPDATVAGARSEAVGLPDERFAEGHRVHRI